MNIGLSGGRMRSLHGYLASPFPLDPSEHTFSTGHICTILTSYFVQNFLPFNGGPRTCIGRESFLPLLINPICAYPN